MPTCCNTISKQSQASKTNNLRRATSAQHAASIKLTTGVPNLPPQLRFIESRLAAPPRQAVGKVGRTPDSVHRTRRGRRSPSPAGPTQRVVLAPMPTCLSAVSLLLAVAMGGTATGRSCVLGTGFKVEHC